MIDPRFPGGTASAAAAEVRALAPHADLQVVGLETAMFSGRSVNPALAEALDAHGLEICWEPPVARADTIVFHNPACLKFDDNLRIRLSCRTAIIVTHENFVRPGGSEGFDVGHCLSLLDAALVCGSRWLAPVSAANRETIAGWTHGTTADWPVAPFDWANICDMALHPPTPMPRDRRGRHSRPGFEKFPPVETMLRHFPPHAERVVILGADALLLGPQAIPGHWDLRRFGATGVERFLEEIDFFVYFTHPLWRESFGRVIAEAIAAGKVVITDPITARSFGPSVVASEGDDVDEIIAAFLAAPQRYGAFVRAAQAWLAGLGPERFRARIEAGLAALEGGDHALL